jgi:hypothetical protein
LADEADIKINGVNSTSVTDAAGTSTLVEQGLEDSSSVNSNAGNISTPEQAISAHQYRPEMSTTCSICIDDFEDGERLRMLPKCKHIFHTDCLIPWLVERQGCCPLCKSEVIEAVHDDEGDIDEGEDEERSHFRSYFRSRGHNEVSDDHDEEQQLGDTLTPTQTSFSTEQSSNQEIAATATTRESEFVLPPSVDLERDGHTHRDIQT